ncbi:MAG: hypothetical protein IT463_05165 [Planctomycetes bacterium]|nr:hypothetical protein [Planctomycetota bacterium]
MSGTNTLPGTLPSYQHPRDLSALEKAQNSRNQKRSELSRDEFFGLMIAELKAQDPLEPMSNSELLGQMSQLEQLNASTRTADGIDNLISSLKFQQLTSASTFIGTVVKAKDAAGQDIQGMVGRVTTSGNEVTLGLQVPVTNAQGQVLLDGDGKPVTREIPVALAQVEQVISPSLVDYTTTIIDPTAGTPAPEGDTPPAEETQP